eukprot:COSAG06_NODE_568_length_14183_cov_130.573843_11_plen_260_part_00
MERSNDTDGGRPDLVPYEVHQDGRAKVVQPCGAHLQAHCEYARRCAVLWMRRRQRGRVHRRRDQRVLRQDCWTTVCVPRENTRECSEPIELTQDTLKFSITTTWDFISAGNQLRYSIVLKDHTGNEPVVTEPENSVMNVDIDGTGWLDIPTTGMIVGGAAPVPVDIVVTTRSQGSQFILDFTFPHFDAGTALYYDPTLGVSERKSGWKWVGILSAAGGGLLAVAAAVGARSKYRSLNPKHDASSYRPMLSDDGGNDNLT